MLNWDSANVMLALIFVSVMLIPILIYHGLFSADSQVKARVRRASRRQAPGPNEAKEAISGKAARMPGSRLLLATEAVSVDDQRYGGLLQLFYHAGLRDSFAISAFIMTWAALIFGCMGGALWLSSWLKFNGMASLSATAAGAMIAIPIPIFWLKSCIKKRRGLMTRSLSDFMDLLVVCIESGLSLEAAVKRVVSELELACPILAEELRQVDKELEFGVTLEDSMSHFANRSGLKAVKVLSSFIAQSRRYGMSICEALREHSALLRHQRELEAEDRAQKASVVILIPILLFIFPATFVVLAGPAVMDLMTMMT